MPQSVIPKANGFMTLTWFDRRASRASAPAALAWALLFLSRLMPADCALGIEWPLMISLPIDDRIPKILASLQATRSLVLVAPPGAGKTTRVPPALLAPVCWRNPIPE